MFKRSYFEMKFFEWLGKVFSVVALLFSEWLKFSERLWLRQWLRPQNFKCALKIRRAGRWKKYFHVMISNEVPTTIPQAYMSLPRHIRKGVLIKRNVPSDLCIAEGCQQFCKESRKLQRIIMFESNYFFFPSLAVVLLLRDVPKTVFWVNQNGGSTSNR